MDPEVLARLNLFGPGDHQGPAVGDVESRRKNLTQGMAALAALQFTEDSYQIVGGAIEDSVVVISQFDDPVDFSSRLTNRVANLVPIACIDEALNFITADTQTVGVYPETLKKTLRDPLALHGGQRLVSLGYAAHLSLATPQDGIEPVRRMCKWVCEETCEPQSVAPLWSDTTAPDARRLTSRSGRSA